ncbi:MAG: signal peptidase II [Erysipelotrichaceae bacterium]|jgi:signal peptidase II|nr:signal peptidase II [Erysipelotrichaceae bacterium]
MKKSEIVLLIFTVLIDQLTKFVVESKMALYESIEIISGFFHITYTRNTGAAWSILEGKGTLFAIMALIVSCGIIYYLIKNRNASKLERTAMILICGGALGNMIDRVVHGYVVDFLNFYIFGYDYPVFNIADSFLVIGVGMLVIETIFSKEK